MINSDFGNKNKSSKIISVFIYSLITFLLILIFCTFLKGTFIIGEDYEQLFFNYESFWNLYSVSDHGCFISFLCMKIIGSFIPLVFGVHPNDNLFGVFIRALDFTILFFLISKFASISTNLEKYKIWYYCISAVIFITYFMLCANYAEVFATMFIYNRHFRYIFPMILYLIFWLSFFKNFIADAIPKGKYFMFLVVISFCVGLSVETVSIPTFFSLILFFIFKLGFVLKEYNYNFLNFLDAYVKDKALHINMIKYLTIISSFLIGCFLFYTSPGFTYIARQRGISTVVEISKNVIRDFPEFVNSWFFTVFVDEYHWVLTLSIVVLSVLILSLNKNNLKNAKVVIFAWILVCGSAAFNFILILSGKTYFDLNQFWLVSKSLNIDTLIILITSCFILLGCYINGLEGIGKDNLILKVLSSIFVIISIFAVYFSVHTGGEYFLDNKKKLLMLGN